MTDGFQDPITAGTNLVIPAINSPNYVLGVTGWAIRIDGSAQFTGVTIIGGTLTGTGFVINSSGAFFYNGAPGPGTLAVAISPSGGIDAYGNAYSSGVTIGPNSGGHIYQDLSGDFLVSNNAGNVVYALYHGDGSVRLYNASGAGAGNLIAAISPVSGADGFSNAYPAGISSISATTVATLISALLELTATGVSASPATVSLFGASNAGQSIGLSSGIGGEAGGAASTLVLGDSGDGRILQVTDGLDGNTYDTARLSLVTTATTPVSSLAGINITGLSWPVAARAYRIRAHITGVQGATAAVQALGLAGPAVSSMRVSLYSGGSATNASMLFCGQITAIGTRASLGAAYGAGATLDCVLDGVITFSAKGTLTIQGSCVTAAADPWTVQVNSTADLEPVVA